MDRAERHLIVLLLLILAVTVGYQWGQRDANRWWQMSCSTEEIKK
jgi:hypothetical protein